MTPSSLSQANGSLSRRLGVRNTRQREAVIEVLRRRDDFASAKTIHQELTKNGHHVGLTTVYRTLQKLAEIHAVDVLTVAGGETQYRRCESEGHHHHLVCVSCGRTCEIEGGAVEQWAHHAAKEHGFRLINHTAEVFGVCERCSGPENAEKNS